MSAGKADNLNGMAEIYAKQGKFEKALECLQQAYEIYEQNGSLEGKAKVWNGVGIIYLRSGRRDRNKLEEALKLFSQAYNANEKLGNVNGKALTLTNIASVYYTDKEYNQAAKYYEESLQLIDKSNFKVILENLKSLGASYIQLRKIEKAVESYEKIYDIYTRINDFLEGGRALAQIGLLYAKTENQPKALHYLTRSQKIFREKNFPEDLKKVNEFIKKLQ